MMSKVFVVVLFILSLKVFNPRVVSATDDGIPETAGTKEEQEKDERGEGGGGGRKQLSSLYPVPQPRQQETKTPSLSPDCHLHPVDPDVPRQVRKMAESGSIQLVKYKLTFPEYKTSPFGIGDNTTYRYKKDIWYRVFSSHGQKLLTMAFNYDALSLNLLQFGVKMLKVPVIDGPPNCFGRLKEEGHVQSILDLLMRDFEENDGKQRKSSLTSVEWSEDKDFVCHQVIEDDDGTAKLFFNCCTWSSTTSKMKCGPAERDNIIKIFYIFLGLLKLAFILFGPLSLQKLMFEGSTVKTSYFVPVLDDRGLNKTILVKKVRSVEDESMNSGKGRRKDMNQFTRFRKLVKTIPSEAIVPVTFYRLDILVDHKELMTEEDVPVGLLRFIYDAFIRCRITRVEPLRSCCSESIFGSWSLKFLWLKLRKRCDCNRGCRDSCSWSSIVHCIGAIALILIVPLPYYFRLVAFYVFEEDEIKDRREALDRLDLHHNIDYNIFQWLTPTNVALVSIYVIYLLSVVTLAILRICDPIKIDGIVRSCVTDMRNIRQSECLRMIFSHILLPFEKFGILGIIVGAIYWPFVLPCCLIVAFFYCVPLVYLTGRLLLNSRPSCCRRKPLPTSAGTSGGDRTTAAASLSSGVTSFDSCFFLDLISPDSRPYSNVIAQEKEKNETERRSTRRNPIINRRNLTSLFGNFLFGFLILLSVTSLLLMYGESFGFLIEVCVLTALGAIVNGDQSIRYVILAFWAILYTCVSCRSSYVGYYQLSRQLFAFIKSKVNESVQAVSSMRQEKRKNTAFKYFTTSESVRLRTDDMMNNLQDDTETSLPVLAVSVRTSGTKPSSSKLSNKTIHGETMATTNDSIEYRDNKLHWNINSLVLFVDMDDVSRIPSDLFWQICKLKMPGSPGPLHRATLKAVGRIVCSLMFLLLLTIVVILFGKMYEVTNPIQMFVLFVCGGLPLIVYLAMNYGCRCHVTKKINEYSLRGKVQRLILNYSRSWPVYDLSFKKNAIIEQTIRKAAGDHRSDGREDEWRGVTTTQVNSQGQEDAIDAMQVDLLITVKDDQEDENIRSEPVSLGSGMSINSNSRPNDRTSPDDNAHQTTYSSPGQAGRGGAAAMTNQPTNASISRGVHQSSSEALQGQGQGQGQGQIGFTLRKLSSTSTLPIRNHVPSTSLSTNATTTTTTDTVVDLSDDVVFVKKIGCASPRNTVSMRSIPSYKHRSNDRDSTSESAL